MGKALIAMVLLMGAVTAPVQDARPLLRQAVAEIALAQARQIDPQWDPRQRDCAGMVRFAYRGAYRRLLPGRLRTPLWRDRAGNATPFADAETLLLENFRLLGRGEDARRSLLSGDLVAFRQEHGPGDVVYHLMLVVRPDDPARADARVVYHPGSKGAEVIVGRLGDLDAAAPPEWKPSARNPQFLGYYRYREWLP